MSHNAIFNKKLSANKLLYSKRFRTRYTLILGLILTLATVASGQMVITEWMYDGTDGGFVEFTNVGETSVDMSGWSFDDNNQVPGTVDLSTFGVVEPGKSVILTEAVAADFATAWGLTDVTIIGELAATLGRNDQINLYDSDNVLVDQLSYGDEDYPATPRTRYASCNIPESDYGVTIAQMDWSLATVGDAFGSRMSTGGDIASPGRIVGYALSDYDMDGDVDMTDLFVFISCYLSDDYLNDASCGLTPNGDGFISADADEDYDVDMLDFAVLAGCYSGEGNPAEPLCGCKTNVSSVTQIILNGDSITVDGTGVTIDGTTATITTAGSYNISGTLSDGQIVVDSSTSGLVEMTLDGVNISNSTNAAINVANASFVSVVLADQTQNYLSDADQYVYTDPNQDEPDGCLFSSDSMAISGTGTLTVYGNYNDAIVSKDELIIYGGTINVTSIDDGIRGKDYLLIRDGDITLTTGGDALKSDNDSDPNFGYITIENGSLDITSSGDGISAETTVAITGGKIDIFSGGGHTATISEDISTKGIKGLVSVMIDGGTLDLDCADDGLHSSDTVTINGGTTTIASGDDGIHADIAVGIDGGTITITDSYEAIEGTTVTITGGDIDVTSDEDAISAETTVAITGGEIGISSGGGYTASIADDFSAKGIKGTVSVVIDGGTFVMNCADDAIHTNDAITINSGTFQIATGDDGIHADNTIVINGGTINITNSYEGIEAGIITINNGNIHVTSSDDGINVAGGNDGSGNEPGQPPFGGGGSTNTYFMYLNGGYIVVNAAGDGLDANGSIVMTGGTVLVNGPTATDNNAIDFDGTCNISGGLLVGVGSAQMAQALSTTSTQRSVKITYTAWKTAGTLIHIQNSAGTDILTFAPAKKYQSCVFSSPALVTGTYKLYTGGSSTGTVTDGLYSGGTYTAGTLTNTFTISAITTNVSAP